MTRLEQLLSLAQLTRQRDGRLAPLRLHLQGLVRVRVRVGVGVRARVGVKVRARVRVSLQRLQLGVARSLIVVVGVVLQPRLVRVRVRVRREFPCEEFGTNNYCKLYGELYYYLQLTTTNYYLASISLSVSIISSRESIRSPT